jgi:hypothetical protein
MREAPFTDRFIGLRYARPRRVPQSSQAPDLLAHPPVIEKIEVLAVKTPTALANK